MSSFADPPFGPRFSLLPCFMISLNAFCFVIRLEMRLRTEISLAKHWPYTLKARFVVHPDQIPLSRPASLPTNSLFPMNLISLDVVSFYFIPLFASRDCARKFRSEHSDLPTIPEGERLAAFQITIRQYAVYLSDHRKLHRDNGCRARLLPNLLVPISCSGRGKTVAFTAS